MNPQSDIGRLRALDALRGVAASVVVFHHLFVLFPGFFEGLRKSSVLLYSAANWISDQNHNAVLGFFLLSGFAIRLSLKSGEISGIEQLKRYSWRRFIRIAPLYWLAIAWTALMGWAFYGTQDPSFSLSTLAGNLAFLQTSAATTGTIFPPFGRNGPFWSLSYEVFYYALLPAALWLSQFFRRVLSSSAFILLASIAVSILGILINQIYPGPVPSFSSLWHIWALGYYLADRHIANKTPTLIAISLAIFLSLNLLLQSQGLSSETLKDLQTGSFIAAIGTVVVQKRVSMLVEAPVKILKRAFGRIGDGSYALYLLHYPSLLAIASFETKIVGISETASTVMAFATVTTMAVIICPAIEKQSLKLKHLFRKREQAIAINAPGT